MTTPPSHPGHPESHGAAAHTPGPPPAAPGYGTYPHPPAPWAPTPTAGQPGAAPGPRPASWLQRWVALMIDGFILAFLLWGTWFAAMLATLGIVVGLALPDNGTTLAIGITIAIALAATSAFCYLWLPTARRGQTLGKRACRVRVVSAATGRPPSRGAAARRAAVFLAMYLTCGITMIVSVIMMFNDQPRLRTLHDRASGTWVVGG